MVFEQDLPVWLAPGNDPSEEAKNNGWGMGQHPPAEWFNWQWNRTYLALKELQQKAVSKDDISDVDLTSLETEINNLKQSTAAHWADYTTFKKSKGQPGGIAALNTDGKVVNADGTAVASNILDSTSNKQYVFKMENGALFLEEV